MSAKKISAKPKVTKVTAVEAKPVKKVKVVHKRKVDDDTPPPSDTREEVIKAEADNAKAAVARVPQPKTEPVAEQPEPVKVTKMTRPKSVEDRLNYLEHLILHHRHDSTACISVHKHDKEGNEIPVQIETD